MSYINFETKTHRAIVEPLTGEIIAYEKKAQHRELKTNIMNDVNSFPYTDEDFLILEAHRAIKNNAE